MPGGITERLFRRRSGALRDRRRAKVIAIATQKGGVGKTTTAVNMAVALAKFQVRRTLLVDLDGQAHVARSLGMSAGDGVTSTLSGLLLGGGKDLMELVRPTGQSGLFVVPSDLDMNTAEALLTSRIGREFLLKESLKSACEQFEFIVLDCPPNLGNLTINALAAADFVLVPCDMSLLAVHGAEQILGLIETVRVRLQHGLRVLGVLPTKVDKRNSRLTNLVLGELHQRFGELVFQTFIPVNSAVARAQAEGKSIFQFSEKAAAARAYRALVEEISQRTEQAGQR